jgi:hypothetical protein
MLTEAWLQVCSARLVARGSVRPLRARSAVLAFLAPDGASSLGVNERKKGGQGVEFVSIFACASPIVSYIRA